MEAAALLFFLALWQGAPMIASTIIGIVSIGGFVRYVRVIAPVPFTLAMDGEGLMRAERGGEPQRIAWSNVAKIKEERFKNGKSVSLTVYKRVGERGLHRAFVMYRDDIRDEEWSEPRQSSDHRGSCIAGSFAACRVSIAVAQAGSRRARRHW